MGFITFRLHEVSRWVGLAGGRGNPLRVEEFLKKIWEIDWKRGTITQVFDARTVAGAVHLAHAARLALLAHLEGMSFADSLAVELMCWTAAERQISRALQKVGLKEDSREVALLSVGREREEVEKALEDVLRGTAREREDGVMEISRLKEKLLREIFSLPPDMVRKLSVQKLVMERVALLALER